MKRQVTLLVVALLLIAVPATASTFVGMSQTELVAKADAVVIARVVTQTPAWTDSGRVIYTDNVLVIEETILGKATGNITVRTFGGQIGDFKVEAHGFPQMQSDEHVLLFLHNDAKVGAKRVLGYQQGHFSIVERLDGVVLAVPQIEEGATLLNKNGRPMAEPVSVPLGQFKAQIVKMAAERANSIEK